MPSVNDSYEIIEILPDGSSILRASIADHRSAVSKLIELAALTKNEICLIHMPSNKIIITLNSKP
jgi:hypothetical protein